MIVLYVAVTLVAIMLTALILIQPSKSGGMGSAFGGGADSILGAQATSHLTKMTVVLTTLFFALVLTLAIISGHKSDDKSVIASNLVDSQDKTEKVVEEKKSEAETAVKSVEVEGAKSDLKGVQEAVKDKK
jgi:preprotein translocase subunit SecG